jgi:hypothetical protein
MKVESNACAQGVWTFANCSMLNLDAIGIAFDLMPIRNSLCYA